MTGITDSRQERKKDDDKHQAIVAAIAGSGVGAAVSSTLPVFISHVPFLVLAVVVVIPGVAGGVIFATRRSAATIGVRWTVLAASVTVAVGVGVLIGRLTAPGPVPAVHIAVPESTVNCGAAGPQCQFTVTGWSAYVGAGLQIRVLIFPLRPSGGGWFIQSPPASTGGSGDWSQAPADLGAPGSPASSGDTLELEAVVVRADATYNGVALSEVASQRIVIDDPRQISGLVSQSATVSLQVRR